MSVIVPDEVFIENNIKKTLKLIETTLGQDDPLYAFISKNSETYALCPASPKIEYPSCFPGGLAYHNLFVHFWFKKFSTIMTADKIPASSLVKVSILHDIGKLGVDNKEYYIFAQEDWKKKKGIYYETNPKLSYSKINHRSLYIAQQNNISLTEDEYYTILLDDGTYDESIKDYKHKTCKMAIVFEYALRWARKLEEENIVDLTSV